MAGPSKYCPDGGPIRFAHYEFGLIFNRRSGTGIDDDIQRELAQRTGCRFEVSLQPRARSWTDLESGNLDMLGSGVQNPQRDRFAWYAHYVVEINKVLLADSVPDHVTSLTEFEAAKDLRMGTVRSFSFGPFYDAAMVRLQAAGRLDQVGDTEAVFRMFAAGRFHAFVSSQFVYGHYVKQLGLKTPRRVENWDADPGTPSGLTLSKKRFSAEQAAAWQLLVQSMLDDGTVRRILVQYMGEAEADASLYRAKRR
ncbi:MAG: transporter substrate-binding domain-containing protein [Burkholderiales bacterium]|nr:transporter substrate-binding domain-containing protein [Burkholderiales bacterium]